MEWNKERKLQTLKQKLYDFYSICCNDSAGMEAASDCEIIECL